jgi:polyisoprenoid-binding protein YceI
MKPFARLSAIAALTATLAMPVFAQQAGPAPSGAYVLEKNHASLTWKVKHLGLSNYTARFTRFDVQVSYNAEDITKSTLTATVDPTSVETDFPNPEAEDFDKKVSTDAKFMNASAFPEIKFVSTGIEKTGENTGKIMGNLTFLGVTKPMTLDATLNAAMDKHPMAGVPVLGISATGMVKRSEFGLKELVPFIGDDVQLIIEAELVKAK